MGGAIHAVGNVVGGVVKGAVDEVGSGLHAVEDVAVTPLKLAKDAVELPIHATEAAAKGVEDLGKAVINYAVDTPLHALEDVARTGWSELQNQGHALGDLLHGDFGGMLKAETLGSAEIGVSGTLGLGKDVVGGTITTAKDAAEGVAQVPLALAKDGLNAGKTMAQPGLDLLGGQLHAASDVAGSAASAVEIARG